MKLSIKKAMLITQGWKNLVFETEEIKEVAINRAMICSVCPNSVKSTFWQVLGDGIKHAAGVKCSLCGCPLSTAIRSLDYSCPDTPPRWLAKPKQIKDETIN